MCHWWFVASTYLLQNARKNTYKNSSVLVSLSLLSCILPFCLYSKHNKDIPAPGRIQTRNPSKRSAADPRFSRSATGFCSFRVMTHVMCMGGTHVKSHPQALRMLAVLWTQADCTLCTLSCVNGSCLCVYAPHSELRSVQLSGCCLFVVCDSHCEESWVSLERDLAKCWWYFNSII